MRRTKMATFQEYLQNDPNRSWAAGYVNDNGLNEDTFHSYLNDAGTTGVNMLTGETIGIGKYNPTTGTNEVIGGMDLQQGRAAASDAINQWYNDYRNQPTPEQIAQAAENKRTQDYNRGFLTDQQNTLAGMLGRLNEKEQLGLGKIGKQYESEKLRAGEDKDRAFAGYGEQEVAQGVNKEKSFNQANRGANNAFRSLAQILGRASGTGSSAFRELLPDVLGKGLNENRSQAIETFAGNMQGIKKAKGDYEADFGSLLQDLLNQKAQQEAGFKSGVLGERSGIESQQATTAAQLLENENPNVNYAAIKAAQTPFRDAINAREGEIMKLDAFTPAFTPKQIAAKAPNINEFKTDRLAVNAGNQGMNPENYYSNLLRKRLQENG